MSPEYVFNRFKEFCERIGGRIERLSSEIAQCILPRTRAMKIEALRTWKRFDVAMYLDEPVPRESLHLEDLAYFDVEAFSSDIEAKLGDYPSITIRKDAHVIELQAREVPNGVHVRIKLL